LFLVVEVERLEKVDVLLCLISLLLGSFSSLITEVQHAAFLFSLM